MGIWDNYGKPGQESERRDEIEVKKTFFKDGNEIGGLGGKARREVVNGSARREEETDTLLKADDGILTTTDPQDQRYPHIAGKDYQGNLVSAGNLHRCMEKGCNRMVSNLSGAEYKLGLWRCKEHYKRYKFIKFLKALFAPFYRFKEED